MTAQAVAEGVFVESADGPRLIAGRRRADGRMRFPLPSGPEAALFEPVELSRRGKLWSWTVQRFRPKTPPYVGADDDASFKPFAVGYVEFEGQVIAEGRIVAADLSVLKIGQPMEVVIVPFPTSTRGETVTYAFAPVQEG